MANSTGKGERPQLHRPFAQPDPARKTTPPHVVEQTWRRELEHSSAPENSQMQSEPRLADQLPPIDQFVDDLPPIDDFLMPAELPANAPVWPQIGPRLPVARTSPSVPLEMDTEGWAVADWQSYDWGGLAALGAPEPEAAQAHAEWTSTNWDSAARGLQEIASRRNEPSGDDVAAALDEIAQRIRSGELSLEQFRGTPPEAAIAAAFGSLLRNRG
jgi:hypothetical protein